MAGKKKVFIALSGGVDSSTAAAILLKAGFDCSAIFMITCDRLLAAQADAQAIADKLGIELHVLDLRSDFEQILEYFCNEYKCGRTPNPCVFCNRHIKFGRLWDFARANGADLLATGHYARVMTHDNQAGLYEALATAKDQSYVLATIDKAILPNLVLPMGDHFKNKNQTRETAKNFGLDNANKKDSQEICFIPDDDYAAVLEHRCPELIRKGNIIDSSGKILGEHSGVHRFTIGQRRGLKIAMGKPYYVVKIDPGSNTVTLGPKEETMHRKLLATGPNWLLDKPQAPFRAIIKIRYNNKGTPGLVTPLPDAVAVEFDNPISAITPGQLAVFYIDENNCKKVAGAAWIDKIAD